MKKLLILFFLLLAEISPSKAQFVTLADQEFASWLNVELGIGFCFDVNTGQFDTTCILLPSIEEINITGFFDMQNLDGLQYFKSLRKLYISGYTNSSNPTSNAISFIPPLSQTLKTLTCERTLLTSLPILPDSVVSISLSNNTLLNTLSPLPAQLQNLYVFNSPTTLPSIPSTLTKLQFGILTSPLIVPVLPNRLKYFASTSSQALSFSQPIFPDSLRYAYVRAVSMPFLPQLNDSLSYFDASYPVINLVSFFPAGLDTIIASGLSTINLPPLPADLKYLNISLTNISCLPYLPPLLSKLYVSENIRCLPNTVTGLQVYQNYVPKTLPLCSPVNNPNQCATGPVIKGTVFYDLNSNGIKEAGENLRSGISVSHNNGSIAYSNNNGFFEISGIQGANTVTLTPPTFYTSVPFISNYQFNTNDTIVSQNYALQPTSISDSIAIHVIPDARARPGFNHRTQVSIENVGSTTLAPTISLRYNNANLIFLSSIPSGTVHSGNLLTFTFPSLSPGERRLISFNFRVNITAALGDTVYFTGTASAGSSSSTDSAYTEIRGSYDPNDKNATSKLSLQQVAEGKWINYLIRFQNTGNDTAIHVVVTDTLSTLLDLNSFQMIGASHPAITKRKGPNLSFEFYNIMLPDSNVNEPASHGYIRFRAKALVSTAAGSIIPNYADIYFDYNNPITTNTTTTRIETVVVPLTLLSFQAFYIGNKEASINWETSAEINTSYFVIQRSDDGRSFEDIGQVNAQGFGAYRYSYTAAMKNDLHYFRLKMVDIDGRFTYSEVRKVGGKETNEMVVFPNPNHGNFEVKLYASQNEKADLRLFDLKGRLVWQQPCVINAGINSISVEAGRLAAGNYIVRIEGTITKQAKLIIQ